MINQYFLDQDYNEFAKDGKWFYKFTGLCLDTKQKFSIEVESKDLYDYHQGKLIQQCFPYLSNSEREWMMSGHSDRASEFENEEY